MFLTRSTAEGLNDAAGEVSEVLIHFTQLWVSSLQLLRLTLHKEARHKYVRDTFRSVVFYAQKIDFPQSMPSSHTEDFNTSITSLLIRLCPDKRNSTDAHFVAVPAVESNDWSTTACTWRLNCEEDQGPGPGPG